jgi:hypothetical protein
MIQQTTKVCQNVESVDETLTKNIKSQNEILLKKHNEVWNSADVIWKLRKKGHSSKSHKSYEVDLLELLISYQENRIKLNEIELEHNKLNNLRRRLYTDADLKRIVEDGEDMNKDITERRVKCMEKLKRVIFREKEEKCEKKEALKRKNSEVLGRESSEALKRESSKEMILCPMCLDENTKIKMITAECKNKKKKCKHLFCSKSCFKMWLEMKPTCIFIAAE